MKETFYTHSGRSRICHSSVSTLLGGVLMSHGGTFQKNVCEKGKNWVLFCSRGCPPGSTTDMLIFRLFLLSLLNCQISKGETHLQIFENLTWTNEDQSIWVILVFCCQSDQILILWTKLPFKVMGNMWRIGPWWSSRPGNKYDLWSYLLCLFTNHLDQTAIETNGE